MTDAGRLLIYTDSAEVCNSQGHGPARTATRALQFFPVRYGGALDASEWFVPG